MFFSMFLLYNFLFFFIQNRFFFVYKELISEGKFRVHRVGKLYSCVDKQWALWCMNMRYCSVISCKNNSTCQDKIFFSFPKNDLRVAWAKFTGQPSSWNPKKWSVICSDHFSPDDLNMVSKRLRPGAIPSSNPQSSAIQGNIWFNFCFKKFDKSELFWFWRKMLYSFLNFFKN